MSKNNKEVINGVTKVVTSYGAEYYFPNAQIYAHLDGQYDGGYLVLRPRGMSDSRQIDFKDLPNTYGTADTVAYCDELARLGMFKTNAELYSTLGTSEMQSAFEVQVASALIEIGESLKEIVYLLKSIAR